MTDRPILFSGPMVRAIIEGKKTQTRRILKPQPDMAKIGQPCHPEPRGNGWVWMARDDFPGYTYATADFKVRFAKGGRLWVRETWRAGKSLNAASPAKIGTMCQLAGWKRPWCPIKYDADNLADNADALSEFGAEWGKTRVAIHMPRWASRLTLTVTDVRVERLQNISKDDVIAEGCTERDGLPLADVHAGWHEPYAALWDAINGAGAWDANPWVVAVTFCVAHHNIDQPPLS